MSQLLERCPTLREMLEARTGYTSAGERVRLHSEIRREYAEALYQTVLRLRPSVAIEVGMAFGVASLAILSALRDSQADGKLISIDPMQASQWKSGGVTAVAKAGLSDRHVLFEDYDYNVLPRLLASGHRVGFAYVDGWHTFDYTLLDWWYIDKMLPIGGVVGLNDCSWPSVEKVIRFVLTHRRYTELDVGLSPELVGYTRPRELLRRLTRGHKEKWYRRAEDRYFMKNEDWEPSWDFFAPF
jgi:predicted O-methyltransferase YrrM